MLRIVLFLALPVFISCNRQSEADAVDVNPAQAKIDPNSGKAHVAIEFADSYANYCSNQQKKPDLMDWINDNQLVTENFKAALKQVIDANAKSSEHAPGYDPIFAAHEHPQAGFAAEASNESEFVVLLGKDWPDFKLTVKVVEENGEWLVDGCGIVNIPTVYRVSH